MKAAKSNISIIREPIAETPQDCIAILRAEYLSGYKIRLWFSDGKEHVVDFEPFLKAARNPMATRYLDVQAFKQFYLEDGNLNWNDYEMCFALEDLYNNDVGLELDDDARSNLETLARRFKPRRNK